MRWMPDPKTPKSFTAATGPYQAHVYLRADRAWQWTLFRQPAGQLPQQVAQGLCHSCEEATAEATAKLNETKRPGRLPKVPARTMTASERSKRRTERLVARAVGADAMSQGLGALREKLAEAGLSEWADRAALIRCAAALRAIAEYSRRNASFFVTSIPRLLDPATRAHHVGRITELAGEIDALADAVEGGAAVGYRQFEAILGELHTAGFWPEGSLVSEVAYAFQAAVEPRNPRAPNRS